MKPANEGSQSDQIWSGHQETERRRDGGKGREGFRVHGKEVGAHRADGHLYGFTAKSQESGAVNGNSKLIRVNGRFAALQHVFLQPVVPQNNRVQSAQLHSSILEERPLMRQRDVSRAIHN